MSLDDPDYYTLDSEVLFYVPIGSISTLVIDYFRSDAHVTSPGTTDTAAIRAEMGFNCDPIDTQCVAAEQAMVDMLVDERSNGTSTGLGGLDRLRSYPTNRFNGAHTEFYGIEFRWNLTEEFTPFNYYFWKDTRTGVQFALFAEKGTVAESREKLWDLSRNSFGASLRLVTGSGSVYRIYWATGDEGSETGMFFFYPWG